MKKCRENLLDSFLNAVEVCTEAITNGNKILIFGNGGSASTASHFANDLSFGTKNIKNGLNKHI